MLGKSPKKYGLTDGGCKMAIRFGRIRTQNHGKKQVQGCKCGGFQPSEKDLQ